MRVEFILCCEKGYLENTSRLLIDSIRTFGGAYKDAAIYAYRPRVGPEVRAETRDFFESHHVAYIREPLNSAYPTYALANKVAACAHREQQTAADVLVFVDSDTFFLRPPDVLATLVEGEVLLRPVDFKHVGVPPDFSGPNGPYWRELWQLADIQLRPTVRTTMDDEEILAYYNSGLVATSTVNGLFSRWSTLFDEVMRRGLRPRDAFFTEQSVLSAAVWSKQLTVRHFGRYYNCPINNIDQCRNSAYSVTDLSRIVHAHYHKMYRNLAGENPLGTKFEQFEAGRKLNAMILEHGVTVKKSAVRHYLGGLKRLIVG